MKIDYDMIRESCECGNCEHYDDGLALDYRENCNCDGAIPSQYRPKRGTIQEKYWYERPIGEDEYMRFLKEQSYWQ